MTEDLAKKFIEALGKLEAERDLETITSLFGEDCEIGNVVTENKDKSLDAREFWQSYRDSFGEIKSTFRNQIAAGNTAALEWNSEGISSDGKPFSYDGVSVLEFGDGDKISRFHAYFDPSRLGRQIVDEKSKEASGSNG